MRKHCHLYIPRLGANILQLPGKNINLLSDCIFWHGLLDNCMKVGAKLGPKLKQYLDALKKITPSKFMKINL